MKDSTRRAIRTLLQGIPALLIAIPILATSLQSTIPQDGGKVWRLVSIACGSAVAVTAVVTKIWNALEAAGVLKPYLKQPPATPLNPDPEAPPAADGVN